jgi:hypothetical protein
MAAIMGYVAGVVVSVIDMKDITTSMINIILR